MNFHSVFSPNSHFLGINNPFIKPPPSNPANNNPTQSGNESQMITESFRLELRVFPPAGKHLNGPPTSINHITDPNTTIMNIKTVTEAILQTFPQAFIHSTIGTESFLPCPD